MQKREIFLSVTKFLYHTDRFTILICGPNIFFIKDIDMNGGKWIITLLQT